MSNNDKLSVYLALDDCSLVNPVGIGTPAVAAAVGAGISNLTESSVHNKKFEPMKMALLPDDALPESPDTKASITSRQTRMMRLAAAALNNLFKEEVERPLPILIATPEPVYQAQKSKIINKDFVALVNRMANSVIDMEKVGFTPKGRAGGLYALKDAISHMHRTGLKEVILLGVDSYLDLRLLAELDQDDRVMSASAMDGFFPGEGAAAILLSLDPKPNSIQIHLPGIADETGHRFSEEPYRGDGLALAVKQALAQASQPDISDIWCSLNGENFGAKEWGVSFTRNHGYFSEELAMHHPAEYFGDIGAAFAPTLLGLACNSLVKNKSSGPVLIWCSSDLADRAAVVVNKFN